MASKIESGIYGQLKRDVKNGGNPDVYAVKVYAFKQSSPVVAFYTIYTDFVKPRDFQVVVNNAVTKATIEGFSLDTTNLPRLRK